MLLEWFRATELNQQIKMYIGSEDPSEYLFRMLLEGLKATDQKLEKAEQVQQSQGVDKVVTRSTTGEVNDSAQIDFESWSCAS